MNADAHFPDPLEFRLATTRNGSAIFQLTHYFRFLHPDFPIVTVPVGTLTDGASIPRPFWNIMGPFGSYFPAAVIHDFLYSTASTARYPGIDRSMADSIFLAAMLSLGVPWHTRRIIYRAVRTFGWIPYKRKP